MQIKKKHSDTYVQPCLTQGLYNAQALGSALHSHRAVEPFVALEVDLVHPDKVTDSLEGARSQDASALWQTHDFKCGCLGVVLSDGTGDHIFLHARSLQEKRKFNHWGGTPFLMVRQEEFFEA